MVNRVAIGFVQRAFRFEENYFLVQVGPSGSGHFVKMVHNGIEYGDMQLICEIYHMMRDVLGMTNEEMADVRGARDEQRAFVRSRRFLTNGTRERWTRS